MKILFVHQNCPGQFKHLAPHLAGLPGNEVVFITRPGRPDLPGVHKVEYIPARKPAASTHHYLRLMEEGVLNGQAVAKIGDLPDFFGPLIPGKRLPVSWLNYTAF